MKRLFTASALLLTGMLGIQTAVADGGDPYIAEISLTAGSYCPAGYLPASGQTLPISSNMALYSLIGIAFGGDGRTYFQLPNLNGRAAMGIGYGSGLTPRSRGDVVGSETTTLTTANLPPHNHDVYASGSGPNSKTFENNSFATYPSGAPAYAATPDQDTSLSTDTVGHTGNSTPMNNMGPSLVMTWCIATTGVYPSRP